MSIDRIGFPYRCQPRAVDLHLNDHIPISQGVVRYIDIWLTADTNFRYGTVMRIYPQSGVVETITFREGEGDERIRIRDAT